MSEFDSFVIPPLSEKLINCISYVYKDNFNYDVLVNKIGTDTGLTGKILTLANSPLYCPSGKPTYNLKQAAISIGISNLIKILTEEYFNKSFKIIDIDFFNLKSFNLHSCYVSQLAVTLAEHLKIEQTNDLMLAGLFHDVALVARASCQKELMTTIIEKCKEKKISFYESEKLCNATPHTFLGKQIATKWKFNSRVLYLIENHHSTDNTRVYTSDASLRRELDILILADTLAHRVNYGFKSYTRNTAVNKIILDTLGLSVDVVKNKIEQTTKNICSLAW
jgi:putative nucleotidyltransferase with HDIG domain